MLVDSIFLSWAGKGQSWQCELGSGCGSLQESCPAVFAPEQNCHESIRAPAVDLQGSGACSGKATECFPTSLCYKIMENLGNNCFTFLFFCFLRNFDGYTDGNGRAGLDCQPTFRGKFHWSLCDLGGSVPLTPLFRGVKCWWEARGITVGTAVPHRAGVECQGMAEPG